MGSSPCAVVSSAPSIAADRSFTGLSVRAASGWAITVPCLSSSIAKPLAVGLIDFIVATMSSSATSVPVTALSSPPARTALAKVTTSFLLEAAT